MARQRSNNTPAIASLPDFGKVPPMAIDLEEAVLGAAMLEKETVYAIMDFLKPECFYREVNQKIFKAITDLIKKGFPADMYTVSEELRAHGELDSVGGPVYLMQIITKVMSAANIEFHARIVAQKYFQRELIRFSTELQTRSFDDTYDVSELLEYAETNLMEISGVTQKKKPQQLGIIINNEVEQIGKVISGEMSLMGIPSGFPTLERATGGFMNQDLIIVACRPSTGKTALALQIAKNIALKNKPVGFFSLEMSNNQIARRYLSGETDRTNIELINGRCSLSELNRHAKQLIPLPIYIDDTPALTVLEMKAKTRRLIIEHGVVLIIVDYLQLMRGEGKNREQEVASCSGGLKAIAKEFNIPVIALSQLNRGVENVSDKKPKLSDLRESGAIEQDADVVMFPHRPAMYKQKSIIINGNEIDTARLMMLILAKNRNGIAGIEIMLQHNESITKIWEDADSFGSIPPADNFYESKTSEMEEAFQ